MMTSKKIILWGGWYGSKNVGDRALLLAITDLLGQVIPGVSYIVLTANPKNVHSLAQRDSIFEIRALNIRKQFFQVIEAFTTSNLLIFGGGVPFFDRPSQIIAMLIITMIARLFCMPYYLWSVSSLPVNSRTAKFIFGLILRNASGITCRDEFTRQLFVQCGVDLEKIIKAGDPVFPMKTAPKESALGILSRAGWQPGARPLVALTPRTLRPADGEAETHYLPKTKDEFQGEIIAYAFVLDWLWEHGYQPIFIPMNTVEPDDDRVASHMIIAEAQFGNWALLVDEEIQPRTSVAIYQYCEASFVSRLHGCVMSIKANCPVIMFAFEQKHVGIMQEVGLSDFIFYPQSSSLSHLIDMLEKILADQSDIRIRITKCLQESSKKSLVPLEQVLHILEK